MCFLQSVPEVLLKQTLSISEDFVYLALKKLDKARHNDIFQFSFVEIGT